MTAAGVMVRANHHPPEKGLSREDAYMLCSLAGDLHIAEAVDTPDMLVVRHLPKSIFTATR